MINSKTDFFKIIDNFKKINHITSIPIIIPNHNFTPKITIGIPTFKRPDLLKYALRSAINQVEYFNYEILVVDNDSSRDCMTEKLMKKIVFPNLSYYKNSENIGMAGNWNRLFELSKGDYLVMLHDDDLLLPNYLISSINFINNNDVGILKPRQFYVKTNNVNINLNDYNLNNTKAKFKKINCFDNYSKSILGAPTCAFFKKEYVIKLGGFNQDYYPSLDYCFFVLFSKYFNVYTSNIRVSVYRYYVNGALNLDVKEGFIKVDHFLQKDILREHKISKFVVDNFIDFNTKKSLNKKSIAFNGIPLIKTNMIFYCFCSLYLIFMKLINHKFSK